MVHLTNHLQNHTIVQGNSGILDASSGILHKLANNQAALAKFPFLVKKRGADKIHFFDTQNISVKTRITTHWTVFEPVRNLETSFLGEQTVANWDEAQIAIVEPAHRFNGQLFDGYHKDMLVIGPHVLSSDAIIFAPKAQESEIKRLNRNLHLS